MQLRQASSWCILARTPSAQLSPSTYRVRLPGSAQVVFLDEDAKAARAGTYSVKLDPQFWYDQVSNLLLLRRWLLCSLWKELRGARSAPNGGM